MVRNKWFIIWIGCGILWLTLLLAIKATISPATPIFYDFMSDQDVSSQYTITPSPLRIFLEPYVGIGNFFLDNLEVLAIIAGLYLLVRIIRGLAKERKPHSAPNDSQVQERQSTPPKPSQLRQTLKTLESPLNVISGMVIILFLGMVISLLIGFAIMGFLFIGLFGFLLIHIMAYVFFIITVVVLGSNLIAIFRPTSRIGSRVITFKRQWNQRKRRRVFYDRLDRHRAIKAGFRETKRVVEIAITFGLCYLFAAVIPWPTRMIATDLAPDEILCDFHIHTCYSDGMPFPAERVEWYRHQGIQLAAFTDHHSIRGAVAAQEYVDLMGYDFTVIIAQEYTMSEPRIHANIYGLYESINPIEFIPGIRLDRAEGYLEGKYMNISDMIYYVKSQGAYVTINHYKGGPYTWEQFRDWGVDGFEIANGGLIAEGLREFCINNSLICIGGTDIHENDEIDQIVRLRLDDPNNRSVDAVFTALRRNEHQIVGINDNYAPSPVNVPVLGWFIEYFWCLDGAQQFSWFLWSGVWWCIGAVVLKKYRDWLREKKGGFT